jgi:hypothetical protein
MLNPVKKGTKKMTPTPDELWKKIIEDLFEDFMAFFMPELYRDIDFTKGYNFLDKELTTLFPDAEETKRFPDMLVKVFLKNGSEQWILIHIEVQGYDDECFSERMFIYFYRIFDLYRKKITALAIFIDSKKNFKPSEYKYSFYSTSLNYKYKTYKVLEQDEKTLENSDNSFAMAVLAALYVIKSGKSLKKKYNFKVKLLRLLISKNYSREKIELLFLFIDGIVRLNEDFEIKFEQEIINQIGGKEKMGLSPMDGSLTRMRIERAEKLSFEIGEKRGVEIGEKRGVEIGEKRGVEIGKKQGMIIGKKQGLINAIEKSLSIKFGVDSMSLLNKIKEINKLEELERIFERTIRAVNIDELRDLK